MLLFSFGEHITFGKILIGILIFLVSLAISFGAIALVVVKIPQHYFSSHYQDDFLPNSSWIVRWGAVFLKNIFGVFLILLGILLSLPGIPGQGFLTIVLGIVLLDIPGKRPLEARIIKRPKILAALNRLRKRYNKPPLIVD
ncbi:MAG: hypothetical protein ACK5NT_01535 [Pyrinomonadaceae bacterium]